MFHQKEADTGTAPSIVTDKSGTKRAPVSREPPAIINAGEQ
jgi:hypothetical protein